MSLTEQERALQRTPKLPETIVTVAFLLFVSIVFVPTLLLALLASVIVDAYDSIKARVLHFDEIRNTCERFAHERDAENNESKHER